VLDPLDVIALPGGQLMSLPFPGEHCDLDVATKQCIFLRIKGRRFAFLVDSDAVDPQLYRRMGEHVGNAKMDAVFIGMECHGAPLTWLYGPLLTRPPQRKDDDSRRLNGSTCERAWGVLQQIPSARAFVYAMGQERWMRYLMGLEYQPDSVQIAESDRFIARCRDTGIEAERLRGCREWLF